MNQPATKTATSLPPFTIDPATTMGAVHLIVRDLARVTAYYTESLGFQASRAGNTLVLSADGRTPLLVLTENKAAPRPPGRSTGLYHVAICVPSRRELARFLAHLAESGTPLQGASDHLASEALYLHDPEGNGLEFYRDRPRESWPKENGRYRLDTLPLDLDDLLKDAQTDTAPWAGLAAETVVGHVHLKVAEIAATAAFYQDLLGFDETAAIPGQAGFISAGGYHHHIGYNVWTSLGAPPPPAGSSGLDYLTIVLPTAEALHIVTERIRQAGWPHAATASGLRLRDPSANSLLMTIKSAA